MEIGSSSSSSSSSAESTLTKRRSADPVKQLQQQQQAAVSKEDADKNAEDDKPRDVVPQGISIHSSLHQLKQTYGFGVWVYFDFIRSIIALNATLFAVQLFGFVYHIMVDKDEIFTWSDVLYSSMYNPSMVGTWRFVNVICLFIFLLFGPVYYYRITRISKYHQEHESEKERKDEDDIIKENVVEFSGDRTRLFLRSLVRFFGFIFFTTAAIAVMTVIQYRSRSFMQVVMAVLISTLITVLNIFWTDYANKLTTAEKHKTWSSHRNHYTFKLFVFRVGSIWVMSVVQGLFLQGCALSVFARQYLIQLLVDLTIWNAVELGVPALKMGLTSAPLNKFIPASLTTRLKSQLGKSEFDVNEEYLEWIYNQYLCLCAMPAFPLITLIALISCCVEIYLDKFKLIYMCKKPRPTRGSNKSSIALFFIMSVVMCLCNFGSGTFYMLNGNYWCIVSSEEVAAAGFASKQEYCSAMKSCPIFENQPHIIPWNQPTTGTTVVLR